MAKRPRMGRNLDALLGGSSKERRSKPIDSASQNDTPATADEAQSGAVADEGSSVSPAKQTDNASAIVIGGQVSAIAADQPSTRQGSNPDRGDKPLGGQVTDANPSADSRDDVSHNVSTVATASGANVTSAPTLPVTVMSATDVVTGTTDRFRMVGVDQIRRGSYQPRRLFDQQLLQELADSIKAEGLIQPIIVRPFAGAYELVAGERRWRAAQLAGMAEIPAIIREMPDKSVAAVSVIENIQRKDLNPLEEAAAFERLCDEFGMTHKAVAEAIGRSRASVTNLMRLLELHDEVKVLVDKGELEMGHARAILGAPKDKQHALAKEVIKRSLTVRAVEKMVRSMTVEGDTASVKKSAAISDPDIERLSQKLGEKLGASVRIQHKSSGKGKLEISYASVSELQGILAHIK